MSKGGQRGEVETERDFVWGDGCRMHYAEDVLLSCILKTFIVVIINDTPIN